MLPLIVAACVVAGGLISVIALDLHGRRSSPLDTEREERWFVAHAPRRLQQVLRRAERRVAGGAAVVLLFGVALIAGTAVGWILDTTDENRGFARWDQSAAEWGAENATTTSTRVLEIMTQFGATGYLLVLIVVVGGFEAYRHRNLSIIGYLATVGLGISLLNNLFKRIVDRDRPTVNPLTEAASSSFPSGHTAAAAACWAALGLVLARHLGRRARTAAAAVAMVITIGVAASRVLLGVHWLTDVIAGGMVGWTWFFVVTLIFGGRILRFGEPAERIAETPPSPSPDDTSTADSSRAESHDSGNTTTSTEYQR